MKAEYRMTVEHEGGSTAMTYESLAELQPVFNKAVDAIRAGEDAVFAAGFGKHEPPVKVTGLRVVLVASEKRNAWISSGPGKMKKCEMRPFSGDADLLFPAGIVSYGVGHNLGAVDDPAKDSGTCWVEARSLQEAVEIADQAGSTGRCAHWANPVRGVSIERHAERELAYIEAKAIRHPRADRALRLLTIQLYPLPLRDDPAGILHNAGLQ